MKLRDSDLKIIKPEMSAKVMFLAGDAPLQAAPLVIVPKKAIVARRPANAVWVVRGGAAHRVATPEDLREAGELGFDQLGMIESAYVVGLFNYFTSRPH